MKLNRFRLALAFIAATAVVSASAIALNFAPSQPEVAAPKPTPSASPSSQPTDSKIDKTDDGDKDREEELGDLKNRDVKSTYLADAVHHDVSAPLRSMPNARPIKRDGEFAEKLEERREGARPKISLNPAGLLDRVVQKTKFGSTQGTPSGSTPAMPSATAGFNGLGSGFTGFTVQSAPPDTNMDVSSTQIVQVVNSSIVVLNKSGSVLSGPSYLNTLWSGFGGDCETYNDGDPTVVFDRTANRWIIGQFAISQNETVSGYLRPYLQCVAVSQTADATGAYYRYSFGYTFFNDYPKMSVWADAYYTTFNGFTAAGYWDSGYICAYERDKMLTGDPARQKCITGSSDGGILVASADAAGSLPPSGTDAYALSLNWGNSSVLDLWRLDLTWGVTPSLTVSSTSAVSVPTFDWLCPTAWGSECVPQRGTSTLLDTLGDRLMNRFSYRKTAGGQDTFVASHSVKSAGAAAVRWYEFRPSGTSLVKYQASTYQPDTTHRWMPSIAMDRVGNIGLVYSQSSSTTYPSINTAGRLASDSLDTLGQGETIVKSGTGSQTTYNDQFGQAQPLSRWGDYASMVVDPADDCTFWSSTEYLSSSGVWNWKTWISKFKFPNCAADATSYTFTGPTRGGVGVASSNFTVTTNGIFNGTITVTPDGAGVDPTPIDLVFNGTSTSKTFTVTPTTAGTVTFTVSDTGGLTDPTPPTYLAEVLATSFTFTGPTTGLSGQTSGVFTVTPNASYTGSITIATTGAGLSGSVVLNFTSSSAAQTFTISPQNSGTVTLTPSNNGGLTNPSALTYTVTVPPPTISTITASGAIGSTITITGTNLSGTTRVKIGGIGASSFRVLSASSVSAVVAPGTIGGQVTVIGSNSQTATSTAIFTVTYPTSTLTTISPTSGKIGTSLVVSGSNLTSVIGVTVGGIPVSAFTIVGTKLYVPIPSGSAVGTGKKVVVSTPNGDVTSTGSFAVQSGSTAPKLSRLSTTRGGRGLAVTITGMNLAGATAVYFNNVAAPFIVLSDTSILAAVPSTSNGNVTVVTAGGTSGGIGFTYQATASTPSISNSSGVTPTAATVGTIVTVNGSNLAGTTSIVFNGIAVLTFKVLSATQITFVVPAGATTGSFTITTSGGTVTSSSTVTIY